MTSRSKDVLRLVNVVFRHGNRTPVAIELSYLAKDAQSYNFHPVGLGELTDEGKENMYKLGTELRKRYDDFLTDSCVPENVEARSTESSRTKTSMTHVLAGLYPQPEVQGWSPQLKTHPIPIISLPLTKDTMLASTASIPKYLEELQRVGNLPEVVKETEEYRELARKLSNFTAKPVECAQDMWVLWNGLMSLKSVNHPLPRWADDVFPDGPLLDGICLHYRICSYNDLLKRLNAGVLLKKMIDDMKTAMKSGGSESLRKINLFSCHELNVVALLTALGLYEPHVPEYSSAIILELIQRDEAFYVKIVHYLGIPPEFEDLEMSECGTLCPFDKFVELTRNFIPSDEEVAVVRDEKFSFSEFMEKFRWGKFNTPVDSNDCPKNKSAL